MPPTITSLPSTVLPMDDVRWFVRMRGDDKDFTTVWLTLGQPHAAVRDLRDARAEENHAQLYEHILRRNDRLVGARFSIGVEGAIFLRGECPSTTSTATSSIGCSARSTPRSSSASPGCSASDLPAASPADGRSTGCATVIRRLCSRSCSPRLASAPTVPVSGRVRLGGVGPSYPPGRFPVTSAV